MIKLEPRDSKTNKADVDEIFEKMSSVIEEYTVDGFIKYSLRLAQTLVDYADNKNLISSSKQLLVDFSFVEIWDTQLKDMYKAWNGDPDKYTLKFYSLSLSCFCTAIILKNNPNDNWIYYFSKSIKEIKSYINSLNKEEKQVYIEQMKLI